MSKYKSVRIIRKQNAKSEVKEFTCQFWEPGLVSYEDSGLGTGLLRKEAMDRIAPDFVGKPVIIEHQDGEPDELFRNGAAVGKITAVRWNADTGWYECDFTAENEKAADLIERQGWSVSCAFDSTDNQSGGVYHAIDYQFEITNGRAIHLALVPNPRYEDSKIFVNSGAMLLNSKKAVFVKENFSATDVIRIGGDYSVHVQKRDGDFTGYIYKGAERLEGIGSVSSKDEAVIYAKNWVREYSNSKENAYSELWTTEKVRSKFTLSQHQKKVVDEAEKLGIDVFVTIQESPAGRHLAEVRLANSKENARSPKVGDKENASNTVTYDGKSYPFKWQGDDLMLYDKSKDSWFKVDPKSVKANATEENGLEETLAGLMTKEQAQIKAMQIMRQTGHMPKVVPVGDSKKYFTLENSDAKPFDDLAAQIESVEAHDEIETLEESIVHAIKRGDINAMQGDELFDKLHAKENNKKQASGAIKKNRVRINLTSQKTGAKKELKENKMALGLLKFLGIKKNEKGAEPALDLKNSFVTIQPTKENGLIEAKKVNLEELLNAQAETEAELENAEGTEPLEITNADEELEVDGKKKKIGDLMENWCKRNAPKANDDKPKEDPKENEGDLSLEKKNSAKENSRSVRHFQNLSEKHAAAKTNDAGAPNFETREEKVARGRALFGKKK